ncbi:MAG: carboxymuconolactone decarboxylase family protein [Solirubrobacteraceae bacterium]
MIEGRRERGLKTLGDVYAVDLGITGEQGPFEELTVDHLFADVWNRPGLDIGERRLLIIGVIAALGRDDLAELQFFSALEREELTPAQVEEAVLHLTHYVGWPLGSGLNRAAQRAIARHRDGDG